MLLIAFSYSVTAIAEEKEEELYTLKESIKTSLENSLELLSADQDILASEAQISQAETGKYPSLVLGAYYARVHPVQTIDFGKYSGGGDEEESEGEESGSSEVQLGEPDQAEITLTFNYPLYDGGITSNLVDQTTLVSESLKYDKETVKQDVIFNVIRAYYDILRAYALLEVAEKNLLTAQEQEKRARAFYEEGLVPRADVSNAEAQVANAEISLISAKKNIEATKSVLKDLMYLPLDSPVEIDRELKYEPVEADLNYITDLAQYSRSEIKKMLFLTKAAQAAIEVAKSEGNPNIYFNFDYVPASSTTFTPSNSLTATIGASIPIFDRGLTKYKVEEAEVNLKKSKISAEQVKKGINLQVKQAYLDLIEAEEQVEKIEESLEAAQENYEIASLRYEEGIAPFLEVTDSRALLTRAEAEKVQAHYNYFIAVASVVRTMGLLPEDGNVHNIKLTDNSSREEETGLHSVPDNKNEI